MVTETETRESVNDLDYVRRNTPPELEEGALVPQTWTGSAEEWRELAAEAREHLRLKPKFDLAHAVAVRGLYRDEVVSGRLRRGARLTASGQVVRRRAAYDTATMDQAARLLELLTRTQAGFDPILKLDLEHISCGFDVGSTKRATSVIRSAESALRDHQAELAAAEVAKATKPRLTVHLPFRAVGGKHYGPGHYRIDPALANELREWQQRMEAQAEQHDWEAPSGFTAATWPPFSLMIE